jgi:L-2-hydroxycarboxylate dehydrogenase (NAD+)
VTAIDMTQSASLANPSPDTFVTVSAEDIREVIVEVLSRLRVSPAARAIQADIFTEADLRGHHSHGVQRLPVLAKRIAKGLIRADAEPEYSWTAESVVSVDGKDGLGPFVAESALDRATLALKQRGIIAVAIRNSSHIGMVGYYCERKAREGAICIALTTTEALVHPYGGLERLVGTNPIAIGIPARPEPFVFDMATSTSAMGKILASKHRGESIPHGWAVDAEGKSTTSPDAALKGALTPAAGAKGYGLGVAIGLLAGLLPGGEIGRAVLGTLDTEHPATKSDLFLLLDPAGFFGGANLADRASDYLDQIRHSRPQQGQEKVIVPGERSRALRAQRLQEGIPLSKEVWTAVQGLKNDYR